MNKLTMSYICSRRCSTRGRPNTDRTKVWFALPCWQSRSRIYLSAGCMARRMRFQGTRSRIHLGREHQKRPAKSSCSGVIQVSEIHLLAMQDRLLLWVNKNNRRLYKTQVRDKCVSLHKMMLQSQRCSHKTA